MKKLYFVRTNAYDALITDDGEIRRVLVEESNTEDLSGVYEKYRHEFEMHTEEPETSWKDVEKVLCWKYLVDVVEDDSSWEMYDETVEELTADAEILAEIEKEL